MESQPVKSTGEIRQEKEQNTERPKPTGGEARVVSLYRLFPEKKTYSKETFFNLILQLVEGYK